MDNYEADDFMQSDPNDPLYKAQLEEIMEEGLNMSMNYAWETIEQISIDRWCKTIPFAPERKIKILNNMITWFSDREEYEKCAVLAKGVNILQSENSN